MMAKSKAKNKTKKKIKKVTGSAAFNISVPKSLLPKIDREAKKYAEKNSLTRVSRSAYVRHQLVTHL